MTWLCHLIILYTCTLDSSGFKSNMVLLLLLEDGSRMLKHVTLSLYISFNNKKHITLHGMNSIKISQYIFLLLQPLELLLTRGLEEKMCLCRGLNGWQLCRPRPVTHCYRPCIAPLTCRQVVGEFSCTVL